MVTQFRVFAKQSLYMVKNVFTNAAKGTKCLVLFPQCVTMDIGHKAALPVEVNTGFAAVIANVHYCY